VDLTHSQYALHALDWIFERPIFKRSDFVKSTSIPRATALRILNILRDHNILTVLEQARGSKSATLVFSALLNIAEGKELF
jgi:hypothetical protein